MNFYFGNFDEAYDMATVGLEAAERAGDPLASARCLDLQADVMQLSTPMAAAEILEVARQRADAAGDRWGAADIAQKIGYSYLYVNRYDEALRWLDQVADAGFNGGNPFFEAWHYNARTCMARRTGAADWADDAARAVAAADDCGELLTIGWAVGYQVEEHLRGGRRRRRR